MQRRHPDLPSISVITATYNSAATVRDTLESVRSQVGVDVEHIIVDGASTDATLAIVAEYPHVAKTLSEPDRGIYDALNKGLALATGDVVGFLHSDDVFAGQRVLHSIASAEVEWTRGAVYGDLVFSSRGRDGRIVRYWKSTPFRAGSLEWGWMPPHPTLFVGRRVYEHLGGFDDRLKIAGDYDFIVRLFKSDLVAIRYLPKVLVQMRVGGLSTSGLRNQLRKTLEDISIARSHGIGGIRTVVGKQLRKLSQVLPSRSEVGNRSRESAIGDSEGSVEPGLSDK